jgi:phage shock protein A
MRSTNVKPITTGKMMLNGDLADAARKGLENAIKAHTDVAERATEISLELYELRKKASHKLIPQVEAFVNSLAATPKEFDKAFEEFHIQVAVFDKLVERVAESLHDAAIKGGASVGVGIAAGATTAFAAPTAAMAIATTFGTASTGTAISTLGGAAATNAALAWLGGGALAAGGGGMSGGTALLALAGPVGLGLAAVCAAGGAFYVRSKNTSIAEEAINRRKEVESRRHATETARIEVGKILELTKQHVSGLRSLLAQVKDDAPESYTRFDKKRKQTLGALINHVRTLGELLNRRIEAGETQRLAN